MSPIEAYNPLDKKHLGESVAEALLRGEPDPLGALGLFNGAGIYAIYYNRRISAVWPYLGKEC
jgi:hypothetical protein